MMEDLSLHVLDIAENSIRAEARTVRITVSRDDGADVMTISVSDDGRGMDEETAARARDPFFSTKDKKTGLGIPFLAMAAEMAGGGLDIRSRPNEGTTVTATFRAGSIDRPAFGDMAETIITLIAGHPDRRIVYEIRDNDSTFRFDTAELAAELEGVPLTAPEVLEAIGRMLAGTARW